MTQATRAMINYHSIPPEIGAPMTVLGFFWGARNWLQWPSFWSGLGPVLLGIGAIWSAWNVWRARNDRDRGSR